MAVLGLKFKRGGEPVVAKPVKGNQGKRYSAEEKAEIVKFIQTYNAEHKRGGMKAASDKFGVSVVTLSNWGKGKRKKAKAKAKTNVKKVAAKAKAKGKVALVKSATDDADAVLKRLQAIRSEITALEKEFNTLKKKL
ncbi:MAG: hypothetical protein K9M49_07190 [Candidatus Marinimicrobia bacterium]|nr:hypothetical protein [Candidatus Neomarinimicrobiota bacterium]MCF7850354.1 hypothetical protein [Candidatus Neomarinimicrobiota bacterium]MCF7904925.1 hypothetical protein [Candidatus Neomarinimicrobiota bacterium]